MSTSTTPTPGIKLLPNTPIGTSEDLEYVDVVLIEKSSLPPFMLDEHQNAIPELLFPYLVENIFDATTTTTTPDPANEFASSITIEMEEEEAIAPGSEVCLNEPNIQKRRSRLGKVAGATLTVAGIGATLLGVGADPAGASAYGCTGYGIGWRYGQPSQFCGQIEGSGTWVSWVGAGFSSPVGWAGIVCNSRVRIEFINTSGNVYASRLSSLQSGCSTVGGWRFTINAWAQRGTVRYSLLDNGNVIAVVQHQIR